MLAAAPLRGRAWQQLLLRPARLHRGADKGEPLALGRHVVLEGTAEDVDVVLPLYLHAQGPLGGARSTWAGDSAQAVQMETTAAQQLPCRQSALLGQSSWGQARAGGRACFCGMMICVDVALSVLGMGWLSTQMARTTCPVRRTRSGK